MPFLDENGLQRLWENIVAEVDSKTQGYPPIYKEGPMVSAESIEGLAIDAVSKIEPKQAGSGEPSPSNVRAISGCDKVELNVLGNNLYNPQTITKGYALAQTGGLYAAENNFTSNFIRVKEGQRIYIGWTTKRWGAFYKEANLSGFMQLFDTNANNIITIPANCKYIRITAPLAEENTLLVSDADITTEYEPYKGNTYTVQLGQTVYGGEFDWKTGKLVLTHYGVEADGASAGKKAEYSGLASGKTYGSLVVPHSAKNNPCMSSHFKYRGTVAEIGNCYMSGTGYMRFLFYPPTEAGDTVENINAWLAAQKAAGTPVTLAYELATPIEIQLTPQQILSLDGENSVWSDCGNTEAIFNTTIAPVEKEMTLEVTGSGNAITSASYDSENKKLALTKGTTYTTKNEFDNLKIGGTNILPGYAGEQTTTRYTDIYVRDILAAHVGKEICISFECKASIARDILMYPYQNSGISILNSFYFTPSTTEFTRHSFVTTVYDWGQTEGYSKGDIAFYDYAGDQNYTIRKVKIELGNKPTDWSPAFEDIDAAIDNIKIGGRNLLTKQATTSTHLSSNITRMDYGFTIEPVDQDTFVNVTTHEDIIQGEEYTLSMECEGFNEGEEWTFYIFNQWGMDFTLKNGKVSYTFKSPGNMGKNISLDDKTREKIPSGTVTVKKLKLEKGNKATDWTPAPEDVDAAIEEASETVKTTALTPSEKTKYYPTLSDNEATETDSLIKNSSISVNLQNGTTSAAGIAQLILGNNASVGTANNMTGYITLYAANGKDHRIYPNDNGTSSVHILPPSGGTLVSGSNYTAVIPTATTSKAGLMSSADKQKLDELVSGGDNGESTITYVTAGKGLTGGGASGNVTLNIGAGSGISVADDSISVNTSYTTSGKNYKVQVDSTSGGLFVNVPWANDNTTYSAGTGISLSGTTFSNSGVRSISSGSTNGTISVNTGGASAEVAVKGLGSAAYTSSGDYLKLSGGDMNSEATIKLTKYGTRFLTIGGDALTFDLSTAPGGWAINLANVKDSKGDVIPLLGAYGTSDNGLTYMYMGDTASSPALQMSKAGVFTFKNTVSANISGNAASASVLGTASCSNTDLNTLKGGYTRCYYGYTGMTNAPSQNIGVLEVIPYSVDWTVQRFTKINGDGHGAEYVRHYYNGNTWSSWRQYVTTGTNATWDIDISGSAGSVAWGNVTSKTNATQSAAGLMSAADKTKLDGIAANANNYTYTLPTASSSTLGGVKIGTNITVSSGTISISKSDVVAALGYTPPTYDTTYGTATQTKSGLMSYTDKKKLDGIASSANNYVLPTASDSRLGGVKIGTGIAISSGVISNAGVRSIYMGTNNGTIKVNTNGNETEVQVKGLGSAAYAAASAFAPNDHTHTTYLSTAGGALSGRVYYADNTTVDTGVASLRNIKVVTTAITSGSTTIPTGEIWLKYE